MSSVKQVPLEAARGHCRDVALTEKQGPCAKCRDQALRGIRHPPPSDFSCFERRGHVVVLVLHALCRVGLRMGKAEKIKALAEWIRITLES